MVISPSIVFHSQTNLHASHLINVLIISTSCKLQPCILNLVLQNIDKWLAHIRSGYERLVLPFMVKDALINNMMEHVCCKGRHGTYVANHLKEDNRFQLLRNNVAY